MATVEAVCTSDKKGIVKKERDRVILKANWGIEGDAHAGDWHRQISLLASESIELVREQLPTLKKGAFAENIITRGIDLEKIGIGRKIQIGASAVLEITQIGKECHNSGCAIKKATGDCIMPREGLFAKVIEGGSVS
ncbi:MAG: MOSC domain-containing protein, partial [Desulfofustis sp.]|nr:MOSC domain-containing protein [Desulfofustis sp.]